MGHSRSHDLWSIILNFPRLSPTSGYVIHVLLSSPPSPEDSRLACLNRIPIAVAAGRINRSQIFDFSSLMDEIETGSLPCFTAVPLNGTLNRMIRLTEHS